MLPLLRSVLYVPASHARALERACSVPADALILDLEDAVAPAEKARARDALAAELSAVDFGHRIRVVRVNGMDTPWGRDDLTAFARHPGVDAILVPKVDAPADLTRTADLAADKPLWAMMETARGVLAAAAIAAHPRLRVMVMGTNDLGRELGARSRTDRLAMLPSLGLCLLAARAEGRAIIDGVFGAFRDAAGLQAEAEQGRDLGFDGKTVIHPDQVAVVNAVFGPSVEDLALAERQIEAFELASRAGQGIAVLDGRIVENLHADAARAMLVRAKAIADRAI